MKTLAQQIGPIALVVGVLAMTGAWREARAHAVEQIFVEFDQEGNAWEAEVLFDAAFALPEFRDDAGEPPPAREWLVERPLEEHARIRSGAGTFLRERLRFRQGNRELAWEIAFPDYDSVPPDFPKLLNGGAYIRVRLRGALHDRKGAVSLEVADGKGPNIVVATGPEGRPRYVTVSPDQRATLLEIDPLPEETVAGEGAALGGEAEPGSGGGAGRLLAAIAAIALLAAAGVTTFISRSKR